MKSLSKLSTTIAFGLSLIACESSNMDSSAEANTQLTIFVTSSNYDGNLGGVDGADTICESEKPDSVSGSVKALVAVSGKRDTSTDWPLEANTEYFTEDEYTIGTTNDSATFDFSITNGFGSDNSEVKINIVSSHNKRERKSLKKILL